MKPRFTEDSWRKEPTFRSLVSAIKACKTERDLENFLRDIATLSELQAMSERLEVASLIAKGLSYRQVAAKTGASTTTVTRVAHFLENGEGGYRLILNTHRHHRMKKNMNSIRSNNHTNHIQNESPIQSAEQEKESEHSALPEMTQSPLQKYLGRS